MAVRLARRLVLALCGLVGLELAYVVAANGVLASGAVQRFVNDTESAHLEFDEAYTLIPGFVHVEGLQLSYEDHNMQFAFDFDEASLIVHIPWLIKQRFSASRVHVEGLRFLFRHKVAQVAGHEAALVRYPEIPHVATPPLLESPRPSDRDDLWSFELQGVDAQIRELWFMTYRYVGPARATGGFQLIPYENLEVGPARLTLGSGTLHNGERRVFADDVRGLIELSLAPVNPETLTGMKAFEPISASVRLDMRTKNLDPVNLYVSDPRTTRVSGGGGLLQVDAKMERAKLTAGSIHYAMLEALRVEHEPIAVETVAMVDLRVAQNEAAQQADDSERKVDLWVSTEHVVLSALSPPNPNAANLAVAERVQGSIEFRELDLTQEFEPVRTVVEAPMISSDHVQRLDALIPGKRKWHVLGGRSDVGFSFQSERGVTQAALDGNFAGLHLQLDAHELRGFGKATLRYGANREHRTSQVDYAEVSFNTLTTRSGNKHTEDWWASLSTSRLQLTGPATAAQQSNGAVGQSHGRMSQLNGTIVARAKNPEPVRQALGIPGIANLVIPDKPLEAVVKLEQHGDARRFQLLHAKTGDLTVVGELWTAEGCNSGAFRVAGIPVPVGIALEGDDSDITWLASEDWLIDHLRHIGCPRLEGLAQRSP